MPCIAPVNLIRSTGQRKYKVTVPCGRCLGCLQKRRAEWTFRIQEEQKRSITAHFITLTYTDEHLPTIEGKPTLTKKDLQLFLKRLRRDYEKGCYTINGDKKFVPKPGKGAKIKYYAVGEYGTETKRPHYHAIIFNLPKDPGELLLQNWSDETGKPLGFVYVGEVNTASIHYVTKYVINRIGEYETIEKPFSLISSKPAIGHGYLIDNREKHKHNEDNQTFNQDGKKVILPRYYRDKLFGISKKERIAAQSVKEYTERENKQFEKLRKAGESVFESQLINYQQKVENFNKNAKSKL